VAEAIEWLGKFSLARLTGTGACVFAAMPDERTANEILARVPAKWRGYIARGLNTSPLLARLELERG
jgi:4-diphosphocytidyl-2-C-methyl-D-erythritol kinase